MVSSSLWISGPSRSGKTTRLIELLEGWGQQIKHPLEKINTTAAIPEEIENNESSSWPSASPTSLPVNLPVSNATPTQKHQPQQTTPKILLLAANSDNRMELLDRISETVTDQSFFNSTTPLGFFEEEVTLFWPLLIRSLDLKAQFPLRLRPETELELARRLWSPQVERGVLRQPGVGEDRMVRRFLDIFQLAAFSGTPTEDIETILEQGLEEGNSLEPSSVVLALQDWRNWCLERGLLTYGIICELYWRYLLQDISYQQHLTSRYGVVLADDVDEYPAIARQLFDFLLDGGATGGFTYNPDGGIRLGLGADPDYLAELQKRCQIEPLDSHSEVVAEIGQQIVELATAAYGLSAPSFVLPEYVQSIETKSRAELLRETAEIIIKDIKSGLVEPQEVAVIAPGLDAIARYTLISLLTHAGIPVQPLKEQRPLVSYPRIRALLTLLTLVYPGLGRLADRDAVAEMLVVLSERGNGEWVKENEESKIENPQSKIQRDIDPVRAGMLADSCFYPDVEHPRLLEVKTFPRWDLLGYRATNAYRRIVEWIEQQRSQQQQRQLPSPIFLLDRAIQKFFLSRTGILPVRSVLHWDVEQLAALRELMETATHYWEVDGRLKKSRELPSSNSLPSARATSLSLSLPGRGTTSKSESQSYSGTEAIARFIGLLRRGAIGANPFPVRAIGPTQARVTLATIFQYRGCRTSHRWQFWLDIGSSLWLSGGAANLFAAPLFLQGQLGRSWTVARPGKFSDSDVAGAEGQEAVAGAEGQQIKESDGSDLERLRRILIDLLSRVDPYGQSPLDNGPFNNDSQTSMSKQPSGPRHRIYLCHSERAVSGQEQTGPLLPLIYACASARPSILV